MTTEAMGHPTPTDSGMTAAGQGSKPDLADRAKLDQDSKPGRAGCAKPDMANEVESPAENTGAVTFLAGLHPDVFLSEEDLAKGFGCSTRTIRRRRQNNILPPWDPDLKKWRVGNILAWLKARAEREEKRVREYQAKLDDIRHA